MKPFDKDKFQCCMIVFASFMIIAINDGIMCVVGTYVSYWMIELNATRFELDWIGSLQMGVAFSLSPVTAKLIRRFTYHTVPIVGGLICVTGFLVCAFTVHISILYIFYGFLSGCGFSLTYMSAIVAVTLNFEGRRPLAMGIIACGTGVGSFAMNILVPEIISRLGWKPSMFVLAALTTTLCFFGALLRPRRRIQEAQHSVSLMLTAFANDNIFPELRVPSQILGSVGMMASSLGLANIREKQQLNNFLGNMGSFVHMSAWDVRHSFGSNKKAGLQRLFRTPEFILLLIASFFFAFTLMTPVVFLFDRLRQKQIKKVAISGILAANGIFGAITRLTVGVIASFTWCHKLSFIMLWLIFSAIVTVCSNYMQTALHFAIYSSIVGMCSGAFIVLQPLVLADLVFKDDLTDGLGIVLLSSGLGYLLGPPVMAIVYDWKKSYDLCYTMCSVLTGLSAFHIFIILCITLRERFQSAYEKRLRQRLEADMNQRLHLRSEDSSSTSEETKATAVNNVGITTRIGE